MDGTSLKRSWMCHYCHDILECVTVVPDQDSLINQLHRFNVKPDLPKPPLQKPKQYTLPDEVTDPGDSWMCTCQKYTDSKGRMHDLEVLVYLDYDKWLSALGIAIRDVERSDENSYKCEEDDGSEKYRKLEEEDDSEDRHDDVAAALLANGRGSSDKSESDSDTSAKRDVVYSPADQFDKFSALQIDESADSDTSLLSNISCVSQFARLHGHMSDFETDTSEPGSITKYTDFDSIVRQTAIEQGMNMDDMNMMSDADSNADNNILKVFDEVEASSQASGSSRGRRKSNMKDEVDAIVSGIIKYSESKIEKPPVMISHPVLPNNRNVEVICVSSGEEDEVEEEKKFRKRRKLTRHKDVSTIDLQAMGLSEEKDNYVRLGELLDCNSCVADVTMKKAGHKLNEFQKLRSCFRKALKERVEQKEYEKTANDQELLKEIATSNAQVKDLIRKKEALEVLIAKVTNNPVELGLLNFSHPQKINGMSLALGQSIVSPYKLAISEDEMSLPTEWSDDLPFKGCFSLKQHGISQDIYNYLNDISEPLPKLVKPKKMISKGHGQTSDPDLMKINSNDIHHLENEDYQKSNIMNETMEVLVETHDYQMEIVNPKQEVDNPEAQFLSKATTDSAIAEPQTSDQVMIDRAEAISAATDLFCDF